MDQNSAEAVLVSMKAKGNAEKNNPPKEKHNPYGPGAVGGCFFSPRTAAPLVGRNMNGDAKGKENNGKKGRGGYGNSAESIHF